MAIPTQQIRLLVVDPHAIVAEGVRAVVMQAGIQVVDAVPDRATAVPAARIHAPDLVLAEVDLPDGTGLELPRELPDVPVLFHTGVTSRVLVGAAIHVGARGYLLKSSDPHGLIPAIVRVAGAGIVLDPTLIDGSHPRVVLPSARERSLARMVIAGETNERIAAAMSIAVRTAEGLLTRTFARLGVASRAELAVTAERGRWDLLPPG